MAEAETPARGASRWRLLRAFVMAVAAHGGWASIPVALVVAASAVLDGMALLVLAPLLALITGGNEGSIERTARLLFDRVHVTGRAERLWILLGLFLLLAAIRAIANSRRDLALARLQTGFAESERNRLINALAGSSWPRLAALQHSQATTLLASEVQRLANACNYLVQGAVQLVLLAVHIVVLFLLAPTLAVAALAMVAIGIAVFAGGQRRVQGLGEGFVKANQSMMASAAALLGGIKSAIAQNTQRTFVAEFESTQVVLKDHQLAFAARQARGRMTYSIASALLATAIIAIGTALAVPPANLLTVLLVVARMGAPAQQLYQSAQTLSFTVPAFDALRRAEGALLSPADEAAGPPVAPPEGPIALRGVTYLHPQGGGVRHVDLVIPAGLFVGIGGPSGSGKTTLADLIVGLLQPQSGVVTVGGEPLAGALRAGWAECVAYVTQDGFLFHDTIRRNLLWGVADATDCAMDAALALVGADPLIARLDQGLDTVVGERGAMLSGGERQRLVLARALLRKPRLLVLDEAASAIDAESEALLLGRLKALDPRPTIVMISHREQSLERCDSIVRVDAGTVRPGS